MWLSVFLKDTTLAACVDCARYLSIARPTLYHCTTDYHLEKVSWFFKITYTPFSLTMHNDKTCNSNGCRELDECSLSTVAKLLFFSELLSSPACDKSINIGCKSISVWLCISLQMHSISSYGFCLWKLFYWKAPKANGSMLTLLGTSWDCCQPSVLAW